MKRFHPLCLAGLGILAVFWPGVGWAQTDWPQLSFTLTLLGDAPKAPPDVVGLPGGIRPESLTGGFSVNTDSREEVRAFFNAIYPSSDGVAMNSTADVANCVPGTNSTAFQEAVLRRINWFRAMGGIPAVVRFDASNCAYDQQAALMMSANSALSHFPPSSWTCFTGGGAHAASNSNIALGSSGAASITGYIQDSGGNNAVVGHRRWLLYPQTQVMGTGDVPAQGSLYTANATWVFDANLFGPRPATRQPCVSWPPSGYVPYPVVFNRWSFALTNADLGAATVTMKSNGVTVATSLQPYATGYGEKTLVWAPMGLDPSADALFPFNGADTTYTVTIGNIKAPTLTFSYTYTVTVFDPSVPGADYVATSVNGPSQAVVNAANAYSCVAPNNPHVTSYQWRVSQQAAGDFSDGAENGFVNFTASVSPGYSAITNGVAASGTHCFYLVHAAPQPQFLQLNRVLVPAVNAVLTFKSRLAYASSAEVARVQASADNGNSWQDLYTQPGSDGPGESAFTLRTVSLASYAGRATLLRFNYDFDQGTYYNTVAPKLTGWALDDIAVAHADQLLGSTITSTSSTNFTFTPAQPGNFTLEAQPVIFNDFGLGWGPVTTVTAIAGGTPALRMATPTIAGGQVRLDFTLAGGAASSFKLLQADQPGGLWLTNTAAILTTNVPGSSYRFTTPVGPASRFYRVKTP